MNRTEHERALEAALRLGEQRFRAVADFTYDWETWVGPTGEVLWINPAVERMTGYSVDECLSMPDYPLGLVHELDRPDMARLLERARARESQNHVEFRILRKDGSGRWAAISYQPIVDGAGEHLGYRSSVRDIHTQKQMEGKLREAMLQAESANRAKSEFLANVSHELRTPLQSILGYSQLLASAGLAAPHSGYVKTLLEQSQLLHRLVSDLLDLSCLQAGVSRLTSERYSPAGVVESAVRALEPLAFAKGLELELALERVPDTCHGDALRVAQVITNLVVNALKFTDRGRVRVSTELAEPGYRVLVDDSGPGLPADPDLFQPFHQGKLEGEPRRGGVGLGLAICRQLCELMGGELRHDQSPYGGARLVACFPIAAAGSPEPRVARFQAEPGPLPIDSSFAARHPLDILVIDDVASAREFMQAALHALGYDAELADSAEAGLSLAERHGHYGLVLLDIQMPGADGWSAARSLRERLGPRAFLVALTADALANDTPRLHAAGFDGFAHKPLGLHELQALLRRAHERWSGAETAAFDSERWSELAQIQVDAGQTLLDRMSQRVLESMPGLLATARAARDANDRATLLRALHDLIGLFSVIGARAAAAEARACERHAGSGSDELDAGWPRLEEHARRVERELRERRARA